MAARFFAVLDTNVLVSAMFTSGNSRKHQPSAPSAHYTSEKVAPTSLGMSLFLDAPLPPGTDRCCLS